MIYSLIIRKVCYLLLALPIILIACSQSWGTRARTLPLQVSLQVPFAMHDGEMSPLLLAALLYRHQQR
jgi:hypothetical protein